MNWHRNGQDRPAWPSPTHPTEPPAKPLPMIPRDSMSPRTAYGPPSRPSFGSALSHPKTIKCGTGKYSDVELVPQPSDDPQDPLNWPRWRKDLSLVSLLITVGLVGGMKTALISTAGTMTADFNLPYSAIAALTAVPIMISSLSGFASSVAAKLWGKRPMYLISALLMLTGSIWNMMDGLGFASCMGARVLQGLGWGPFDALVLGSIQDMYFEHERNLPVSLYNIFTVTTTWGAPLIGGLASDNAGSFTVQFRIVSALFILAIPFLALGAPETAFDRSAMATMMMTSSSPAPADLPPWRPWRLRHRLNQETALRYFKSLNPLSYRGIVTLPVVLQAARALAAPTTWLVFLLSMVPYGSLWGLAAAMALITSPPPLSLHPSTIGTLMAGPWLVSALVIAGFCFFRGFHQKFTRWVSYSIIVVGAFLTLIGLLSFGLGIDNFMILTPTASNRFFGPDGASQLSLPLISFQLGVLAAGFHILDTTTRPLLARSASFTSSSIAVAQRCIGDMHSGISVLRNLAAGVLILVLPAAVARPGGLKAAVIGLAAAQALLAALVTAAWYFGEEAIWRADGKLMGLIDIKLLKESASFFDHD